MSTNDLTDHIIECADRDFEGTLSIITGAFLGLYVGYVARKNEDPNKAITINAMGIPSNDFRTITIHPAPVATGGAHEHAETTH